MLCCHALLSCYVVTLSSAFAVVSSIRFGKQHKKITERLRIRFYRIMRTLTRLVRREVNTNCGMRGELWLWFTKLLTRFVELSLPLYASLTCFRGTRMHVHFSFTVQSQ